MKAKASAFALVALSGLICMLTPPAEAAGGMGSIRGLVKDLNGAPLPGAAIVIASPASVGELEHVIKRAQTDSAGKFVAAGIAPGHYTIKAQASGFRPVEVAALVKPNKATVFDSILMRRIGTLAEETDLNLDPKYASRSARDTIFHFDEDRTDPANTTETASAISCETHGFIQTFGEAASGRSPERGEFAGADFAVSEQIGAATSIILAGQAGTTGLAPERLQAVGFTNVNDRQRIAFAFGYGRFTLSKQDRVSQLGEVSLRATDTWQIAGPVMIVYGIQYDRFADDGSASSMQPRLGLTVNAGENRFFAGVEPGSSQDVESVVNLESAEIVFPEEQIAAVNPDGTPIRDRSFRVQIGGERRLSQNSSIEVMAFVDEISGHPVGLMPVSSDLAEPAQFRADPLNGRSRGIRVVYHRHINSALDSSVGYAVGEGEYLNADGVTNPAALFSPGLFQVFSAKLDASFVRTGTRISTVLRLAPRHAIFAIDPFQGQISTYDPTLSLFVSQQLPILGFMRGQWAAILDLRNLLDQQASISNGTQELVDSRFHRLIRVGVSVRF